MLRELVHRENHSQRAKRVTRRAEGCISRIEIVWGEIVAVVSVG